MRKILCIIFLVFAPILAIGAEDKAYSIESVPNVYAQDRRLHVSDPNGLLMPETQEEINRMLTQLEDSTGIQSMVVMLPSIGHEDIFDFAHNLFRHWGIGNKESNNGMLIVYVADQRKIRFTTGYGLEGILPDAMCKRIQSRYMVPHFREGNTDLGMLEGTKAVVGVLDGSMKAGNTEEDVSLWEILLVMGAILFIIIVPIWLIHRQAHTCPKCAKAGALKVVSQTITPTRKGKLIRRTLLCSSCGHTVVKEHHQSNNDDTDAMIGGMMMGSMLGGRRRGGGGGGSFMGGSFGGGSTGGGGSTSGW